MPTFKNFEPAQELRVEYESIEITRGPRDAEPDRIRRFMQGPPSYYLGEESIDAETYFRLLKT